MAIKNNRRKVILMMATLLLGSFITTLAETLMNNGLPICAYDNPLFKYCWTALSLVS